MNRVGIVDYGMCNLDSVARAVEECGGTPVVTVDAPLDEPVDTGEDTVAREIAVWEENPEQKYSREELGKILEEAVDGLRPAFRTVFVLRDIEDLSTEETAEVLGISIPAVKSRLLRARLQLREKLTRFFKRKGDDVFAYL